MDNVQDCDSCKGSFLSVSFEFIACHNNLTIESYIVYAVGKYSLNKATSKQNIL
jgi:hypothetical protein